MNKYLLVFLGKATSSLSALLLVSFLTKILPQDLLAHFYYLITLASFLSIALSFGIQSNLANLAESIEPSLNNDPTQAILGTYLIFAFTAGTLCACATTYLGLLSPDEGVALGVCLFTSISQIVVAELFRFKGNLIASMALGSQAGSIGGTINIAVFLIIAFVTLKTEIQPKVSTLILQFSILQLILVLIASGMIRASFRRILELNKLINPTVAQSSVSIIVITAIGYIDIWAPKLLFPNTSAGFVVASSLSKYVALGTILTSSTLIFSLRQNFKRQQSIDLLTKSLRRITRINALLSFFALTLILLFSKPIIRIIYDPAYQEYWGILTTLSVGQAFYSLNSAYYLGLIALDRFDLVLKATILSLLLTIVGIAISATHNSHHIFATFSAINIAFLGLMYRILYERATQKID